MKYLIEFCGIFNPGLIATIAAAGIFFVLYNTLSTLNKNKKTTIRHSNLSEYQKVTGKICGYENKLEKKIIKKEGRAQEITTTILYPVVEYVYNDETRVLTYNTPFYKQTEPNVGYEFAVYVNINTEVPVIKYEDIYYLESRSALIIAYVTAGLIAAISLVAIILSFIANLS